MKCLICGKDMPFDCTCTDMGKRIQLARDVKLMADTEELYKVFVKNKLYIEIDN